MNAYYIGADISKLPVGWHTYEFPINASSPTIPPGWVVTKGNGRPGTDADWQALMGDVETLGVASAAVPRRESTCRPSGRLAGHTMVAQWFRGRAAGP